MKMGLARSERFELPALGIEIRFDGSNVNRLATPCCDCVALVRQNTILSKPMVQKTAAKAPTANDP